MTETDVFKHSTPELYDRYMGPLLFAPYAGHVAKRVRASSAGEVLETARGPASPHEPSMKCCRAQRIVATDINPAVVEFAAQHFQSERVTFQGADAQELPFDDATFDFVLCVFGIMFFPDKVRANAEARRVLRPGGRYVLVTFNRLDLNPGSQGGGRGSRERSFQRIRATWNEAPSATRTRHGSSRTCGSAGFQNGSNWRPSSCRVWYLHKGTPPTASCSALHSEPRSNGWTHRLWSARPQPSSRR